MPSLLSAECALCTKSSQGQRCPSSRSCLYFFDETGLLHDVIEEEPAVIADVMRTLGRVKLNTDGKLDCFHTCIAHDHRSGGEKDVVWREVDDARRVSRADLKVALEA
jgi:hypothetical protein